jgi:hypothetical protein
VNRNLLKFILLLGIFFVIVTPSCALQLTNTPKVYVISNNTTITHVFYCSLDHWDEHRRNISVNTSSPSVLDISPSSFTLSQGFLIPVIITIYANESDTVIPVSFTILPSQYQTIGVIEIQHRKEIPIPTPTPIIQINSSEKEIMSPFPIAFLLNGVRIFGPEQPLIVSTHRTQILNIQIEDLIIVLVIVIHGIFFIYMGREMLINKDN